MKNINEVRLLAEKKLKENEMLQDALLNIKRKQISCCVYDDKLKQMFESLVKKKKQLKSFLSALNDI